MEDEDLPSETHETPVSHVGEELRAAREAKGMDIAQIAAETRIPQRHLEAIEVGDYHALPSRTYAIGFTRTYARTVGLDEHEMIDRVRAELAERDRERPVAPAKFEPGDPARVPSGRLALFGALAAILLLVGGYAFYSTYFSPGIGPAPLQDATAKQATIASQEKAAPPQAAATPSGPVVFTSQGEAWVSFSDASGATLYEALMTEGDSYTVPADADAPVLVTGRPDLLAITIGGQSVPKVSEELETVVDVPVSAEALLARSRTTASPAPAATPAADRST